MAARLEHDGEVFGLLTVTVPEGLTGGEEEQCLFREVADDIAFALHNLVLEQERVQAASELAISHRIAEVFLTMPDDEMYAQVLKVVLDAVQSPYGVFGYLDGKGDLVVPSMTRHIWDQCEVPDKAIVFPRDTWGDSIWPRAIRQKKLLYSNEPSTLTPKGHVPIRRNAAMPLLYQGEVIGLLQVGNRETDYEETDLQLLSSIAAHIAPILHARLQRDREEKARIEAEAGLEKRTQDLAERLKERNCLYAVSRLAVEPGLSLAEALQRAALLIPPALQYPEIACARITYEGDEFTSDKFSQTEWSQAADIAVAGQRVGAVEVWYLAESPEADEGPFLTEESDLVDDLGRQLSALVERDRAEQAVRESEDRFRTLFEGVTDGILVADLETRRFVSANHTMCEMLGHTSEELLALGVSDIHPEADVPQVAEMFRKQSLGEATFSPDLPMKRKDGTVFHADVNSTPVALRGRECLLGVFRDTTGRREAEQQKLAFDAQVRQNQKLESIGTLAGGVAHEINNPINGIMNYAQLILDKGGPDGPLGPDSPVAEYAGEIIHETERVAEIVRNLLSFARQEKQGHSPAGIADIVQATLVLIRTVIRRDQIVLEVDLEDGLPKLKCRSQQIQQVLMNLMTNGRDALNERYPAYHENKIMTITVRGFEKEGRPWIRTTVEDRGAGIKPEVRERMFDPFFTTKPREKGTGLGLSVSHGIVQDHHGELHVESEPGQYTRFHLDLPVDNGWEVSD